MKEYDNVDQLPLGDGKCNDANMLIFAKMLDKSVSGKLV